LLAFGGLASREVELAELVVDCGYCDQPHLNRRAPKDEFYGERS